MELILCCYKSVLKYMYTSVMFVGFFSEPSPSCTFHVACEDCPNSCETTLCKMQRLIVRLSLLC